MAYIERETALKIIDNYSKTVNADGKAIVEAVRDIVDTICPTADVVEVRHGYWEQGDYYDIGDVCSECEYDSHLILCKYKYCPQCGAKMDGKDGE